MAPRLRLAGIGVVVGVGVCLVVAGPVRAAVPLGFFGVVPQGPLSATDFDRMRGVVGTLRVSVDWNACEPQQGVYELGQLDETIASAVSSGLRVLPVVTGVPAWLPGGTALSPVATPTGRAAWAAFVRELARRYGPGGTLWALSGTKAAIHRWQIGNEPNFALYWGHPSPRGYARLLAIAAKAIRREDSAAQIVLAGLAPVNAGPRPWVFLRSLYRLPGIRDDFDVVALHPYSSTTSQLKFEVEQMRRVMSRFGDNATPLLVSELGVASGGVFPSVFVKGPTGQAVFLRRAFKLLLDWRRLWHIAGVDWFAWQDVGYPDPHCSFCQMAGLFDVQGRPKPAWSVFRRLVAERVVR